MRRNLLRSLSLDAFAGQLATDEPAEPTTQRLTATPEDIARAGKILRTGGTVAFPTETVYGLGANALDATAVAKHLRRQRAPQLGPRHRPRQRPRHARPGRHRLRHRPNASSPPSGPALSPSSSPAPQSPRQRHRRPPPRRRPHARPPHRPRPHRSRRRPHRRPQRQPLRPHQPHHRRTRPRRPRPPHRRHPRRRPHHSRRRIHRPRPHQSPCILYRPGAITAAMLEPIVGPVTLYQPPQQPSAEPQSLPSPGVGIRHYAPRARLILVTTESELNNRLVQLIADKEKIGVMLPQDWTIHHRHVEIFPWNSFDDNEPRPHPLRRPPRTRPPQRHRHPLSAPSGERPRPRHPRPPRKSRKIEITSSFFTARHPYTPPMQAAEIELKFPVSDPASSPDPPPASRLSPRHPPHLRAQHPLRHPRPRPPRSRQILRLRQYGGLCTLTHKRIDDPPTPTPPATRFASRPRPPSPTAHALAEIFEQLGYLPAFIYEKYRTEWSPSRPATNSTPHLVIDETPIGTYAELEGPTDWIDRTLADLNIDPATCLTDSYGKLFLDWKQRTGSPAENLTFAEIALSRPHPPLKPAPPFRRYSLCILEVSLGNLTSFFPPSSPRRKPRHLRRHRLRRQRPSRHRHPRLPRLPGTRSPHARQRHGRTARHHSARRHRLRHQGRVRPRSARPGRTGRGQPLALRSRPRGLRVARSTSTSAQTGSNFPFSRLTHHRAGKDHHETRIEARPQHRRPHRRHASQCVHRAPCAWQEADAPLRRHHRQPSSTHHGKPRPPLSLHRHHSRARVLHALRRRPELLGRLPPRAAASTSSRPRPSMAKLRQDAAHYDLGYDAAASRLLSKTDSPR